MKSIERSSITRVNKSSIAKIIGVAAVAAMLLTGCAPSSPKSTSAPVETVVVDKDATLNFGISSVPLNFDPHLERNSVDATALARVWDRLLMQDYKKVIKPGLATSWETSADGLNLTLQLRKGVSFHDGTPLTSTSVKASINRAQTLKGSTVAANLAPIASVDDSKPQTAVLILKKPAPYLLAVLAGSAGVVMSEAAIASGLDISKDPYQASSAAYRVTKFVPNTSVSFVRDADVSNYWDPASTSNAVVNYTLYTDSQAALAAVKTGVLDLIVAQSDLAATKAAIRGTDLKLDSYATEGVITMVMNTRIAPFNDIRVRQAVIQAVDRAAVTKSLLGGADVATTQGFPKSSPAFDPKFNPFPFDAAAAKKQLTDASATSSKLTIVIPDSFAPAKPGSLAVQEALNNVGVTAEIQPVPTPDLLTIYRQNQVGIMYTAMPASPDVYLQLQRIYFGTYQACGDLDCSKLQRLLDESNAPGLSATERARALQSASKFGLELATQAPFAFRGGQFVYKPTVNNVDTMPGRWAADTAADPRYVTMSK